MGSFSQALAVSDVGVYAGNHATSGSPPAFQALVDYFFNTASPISPEDAVPPVVTPVVLNGIKITPASTAVRVEW